MNMLHYWRAVRHQIIFPQQFAFAVFFLKIVGNRSYCKALMQRLAPCAEGTIGKELWHFMQKNNIQFVPWYEKHDMKHVILGFLPHPSDEMRMQAFMFGNCGFPPLITFIYCFFVIWTPEMWHEIPVYYQLGKQAKRMANLEMESILHHNLEEFRKNMQLEALFHYRKNQII